MFSGMGIKYKECRTAAARAIFPPAGCIRDGMPVFCGLFPSGYRAPPRSWSPPAFRPFSASGHQPQYADCQTRTGRPVQSPVNLPPAHTSAVHGALSLPWQPADMAMMCFHSQPRDEYGETDDTGIYPAHQKDWPSGCTRSQTVYR